MYQALYRKYRPQTFDDVVGQRNITETLKAQLRTGRFGHAYLFTGTRGTGKTSCAKILSRAINCEDLQDGNPCGCCPACQAVLSDNCMDVLEIDAASNNGVDHVRTLRDEAVYSPSQVRYRVYIIDEVHMLSMSAFNALLKIIEEPPQHLVFILATTELHKVPATILSRCQRFSFRRLLQEDISARLNYIAYEEGIETEPEAIRLLARLADGALRDGISLLDQCASATTGSLTAEVVRGTLGLASQKETARLLQAAADRDAKTALELFSSLYAGGKDISAMIDELMALSRDLLVLKTTPKGGLSMLSGVASEQEALALLERFTAAELLRIITVLQATAAGFSKSVNRRVDAELCLLRLCDPGLDLDAETLNARLSRVEDRLAGGQFVMQAAPAAPDTDSEERPPMPGDEDVPPLPDEAPPKEDAAAADNSPAGFWADFLDKLHPRLPGRLKGYFCAEGPVKPALQQDLLTLVADTAFVKQMVDIPQVAEAAAEAASAVLSRPIRVRFTVKGKNGPAVGGPDPMESLLSFGRQHSDIIKIKE